MDSQIQAFSLVFSLPKGLVHMTEGKTVPVLRKEIRRGTCFFPLRSGTSDCTYHSCSHPVDRNLVTRSELAVGEPGKCILQLEAMYTAEMSYTRGGRENQDPTLSFHHSDLVECEFSNIFFLSFLVMDLKSYDTSSLPQSIMEQGGMRTKLC